MTDKAANPADSKLERITLTGGLNIYNAPQVKTQLLQAVASAAHVELDLLKVEELDTAGLQVLVLAKREAIRHGHRLAIVAHSAEVQEALDLCGMVGWFGDPMLVAAEQSTVGS
jgi:anti-anti-sigma factor